MGTAKGRISTPKRRQGPPEWNEAVASRLREAADLLALQGANPFRVIAFRRAATTVEQLPCDIRELAEEKGPEGLVALPSIGRGIAAAIIDARYG